MEEVKKMQESPWSLESNTVCEVEEDEDFVFETSLFSNKVLKQLEMIPDRELASAESPALKRALLFDQRQRASSLFLDASQTPTVPLIDRLLGDPNFPLPHHVQKVVTYLLASHTHCPPGSLTTLGALGTGCLCGSETAASLVSADTLLELVKQGKRLFQAKAAVETITVPMTGRVVTIGDTHSQLEDVLWIFFKHGWPKQEDVFIFNGDIVDRGNHAVEIFVLLFILKQVFPRSVYIVRGNHEASDYCVLSYGFHAELKCKFGPLRSGVLVEPWLGDYVAEHTRVTITQVKANQVFIKSETQGISGLVTGAEICLADGQRGLRAIEEGGAVIRWEDGRVWKGQAPRVFIVHGGIPVGGVRLEEISRLPFRQPVPAAPKTTAEMYMYQMVWSDPKEEASRGVKSGRGTPFYPEDTAKFCDLNNLLGVIRSHQLPVNQRGYQMQHERKLLTVFSASNYCGTSMNCGGVVVWNSATFGNFQEGSTLLEHYAPPLGIIREIFAQHQDAASEVKFFIANELERQLWPFNRQRGSLVVEQRVLEYVRALLVKYKLEIMENIKSFIRSSVPSLENALVSVDIVVDVLNEIIGPQFPWRPLLEQLNVEISQRPLVGGSSEEQVMDFVEFTNFFSAKLTDDSHPFVAWSDAVVQGWFAEIFDHEVAVEANLLHTSELLDVAHFRKIFATCGVTGRQLDRIFHAVAGARTHIPRQEIWLMFGDFFRSSPHFAKLKPWFAALNAAITAEFDGDAKKFFRHHLRADNAADGRLRREEFVQRLVESSTRLGLASDFPVEEVAEALTGSDGRISYLKFVSAMNADGATGRVAAALADHASSAIFFHRTALRCAFDRLDRRASGQLNRRAFKRALAALNTAVDEKWKLASLQLETAIDAFAWEEDMEIEDLSMRPRKYSVVKMNESIKADAELSLWVTYEDFVKAFDIVDTRRMDRKGSCGWNLLRDSFASFSEY